MPYIYHYTDKDGYNGIRSAHPDWKFEARRPPGDHPTGAYFTRLPPNHFRLAKKLGGLPARKIEYCFEIEDCGDLRPLRGSRGHQGISLYSARNYLVPVERQKYNGLCSNWKEGRIMINGYDIVFDSHADPKDVFQAAWLLTSSLWPDAVVEDANTGTQLAPSFSSEMFASVQDIFIYKDIKTRDSDEEIDGEPAYLGKMIHVLADPGCTTLVVNDPEEPVATRVIQGMKAYLESNAEKNTALLSA